MTGKRKTEARRWFQQAFYDLQAARWNVKGGFYDTACFLAQQGGEKALTRLLDHARELDLHYIPSRYPNGIPSGYPHQFYSKKVAD